MNVCSDILGRRTISHLPTQTTGMYLIALYYLMYDDRQIGFIAFAAPIATIHGYPIIRSPTSARADLIRLPIFNFLTIPI